MRNSRWLGALAVVILLVSAGCGGDTDEGTTTDTTTDQMGTEGTTGTTTDTTGTMGTTDTTGTGTMGATDDATLQTNVQNAIAAQPGMTGVTVTVSAGTATLSGTVASEADKTAAETTARAVAGVTNVVNSITVGGGTQ
jgi:hypothetical protein